MDYGCSVSKRKRSQKVYKIVGEIISSNSECSSESELNVVRPVDEHNKKGLKRRKTEADVSNGVLDTGVCKSISLRPQLFVDDSLSLGGRVKSCGVVLKTQLDKCKCRQPNVNCRVEAFGRICSTFDDRRRLWVKTMGFDGLLEMVDMYLPRNLCYWLFTRVDPITRMFISPGGQRYNLTANQVGWILGIPKGKMEVPKIIRGNLMKARAREIQCKFVKDIEYTMKKTGKVIKSSCIPVTDELISRLEAPWEEGEEEEFKLLFLIVALDMVLCPTLNGKMGVNMIPALTCASRSTSFDWCRFVFEFLIRSVTSFAKQFYRRGYAAGCAGCSIFLAIFYVDRLNRPPVSWGVWPRLKAWNMAELSKARLEDRVNGKGDYGNVGCVDIVYGEGHPNSRKDPVAPYPNNTVESCGVEDSCMGTGQVNDPTNGVRKKRGRKLKMKCTHDFGEDQTGSPISQGQYGCRSGLEEREGNPVELNDDGDNMNGVNDMNNEIFPTVMYRGGVHESVNIMSSGEFNDYCSSNGNDGNCCGFDIGCEVGGKEDGDAGGNVVPKVSAVFDEVFGSSVSFSNTNEVELEVSGEDVGQPDKVDSPAIVELFPLSCNENEPLKQTVCKSRKKRERHTKKYLWQTIREILCRNHMHMKQKLLSYVRKEGDLLKRKQSHDDPVLIRCGTLSATLSSCYSVCHMRSGVDDQYVRTIAALFTSHWMNKYHDRSFRCVLDPTIAIRIMKEGGLSNSRVAYLESYFRQGLSHQPKEKGFGVERISEVFIPVLQPLGNEGLTNHWWCLAVSLNSATVYVIDSNTCNGVEEHCVEIELILNALESVLKRIDSSWNEGCMCQFHRKNLRMPLQPDVFSCGVFMLHAIYECAERFPTEFYLDEVAVAREWLLTQHVLLPENEALAEVKRLLCG